MLTYLLIGINVAISFWAFSAFRKGVSAQRFLFTPSLAARGQNLEGAVLSQFSHADIGHLIFNMLTLYFFGPVVERLLGYHLLTIYFAAGIFALLLVFILRRANPEYRVLGASGSITGVLFASIVLNPSMSIYFIFIPVPIPSPVFAVIYLVMSTLLMSKGVGNVSHEAHLGGALTGLLLAAVLSPEGFGPLAERVRHLIP